MREITLRQAELSDVPAISAIETRSFASPRSAEAITRDVTAGSDVYFVVAEDAGEVLGYADMKIVAGEAQIYDIAVDPGARERGIGEALLRKLIQKAEESGCDLIDLEVRAGNAAALALYKKLGFVEVGRRKGYYGKGEDAVLMDLDIVRAEIDVEL